MICNSTHRLCLRIDETTGLSRRKRKFFKNDFLSFPRAACRDVSFLISSNIEARRGCWFIEDESAASIQIFEELSQILRVMCIMGFELLFRTLIETLTHKADGLTLIMISKKKSKNISRNLHFQSELESIGYLSDGFKDKLESAQKCSRKIEKLKSAQNDSAKLKC